MQEEYSKLFKGQDWELQLIVLIELRCDSSKSLINTCSDLIFISTDLRFSSDFHIFISKM